MHFENYKKATENYKKAMVDHAIVKGYLLKALTCFQRLAENEDCIFHSNELENGVEFVAEDGRKAAFTFEDLIIEGKKENAVSVGEEEYTVSGLTEMLIDQVTKAFGYVG